MENYVSSFPFSSSSSSPTPSSLLSLNPSSSSGNNIFVSENNNNNSLRLGYGGNNLMKISSNNNPGFLGLMSEMDQQVQGNNTSSGTSVASHMISLDSENKLGINDNYGVKKIKGEKKAKKPKYAFQTRSQVDILDDGYRWRKYGQKAVKNNKFPRSYYRCTHQGCMVKKQVQRLTNDEEVVVTTYEGMHSHSIDKSTDNFEHILSQMQIYSSF